MSKTFKTKEVFPGTVLMVTDAGHEAIVNASEVKVYEEGGWKQADPQPPFVGADKPAVLEPTPDIAVLGREGHLAPDFKADAAANSGASANPVTEEPKVEAKPADAPAEDKAAADTTAKKK